MTILYISHRVVVSSVRFSSNLVYFLECEFWAFKEKSERI